MFAGFSVNKSAPLYAEAIAGRTLRQNLISGNIANIDTPFYKARDVDFESALIDKSAKIYKTNREPKLELARTNEKHFAALEFPDYSMQTIYLRDGHLQRNDANTVDLDVETSELSKNSIMIQALDTANSKLKGIFKNVIETSSKLS